MSSEKSACPGVSTRLTTAWRPGGPYSNCSAAELMEMPRAFSMSIQSDTVLLRPALPWIAPASWMTRACRASASVKVDLPASGWLMTANVRRRAACCAAEETAGSSAEGRTAVIAPV